MNSAYKHQGSVLEKDCIRILLMDIHCMEYNNEKATAQS